MLLVVIRDYIGKDYTGGVLLVDGKEFSRTIEPPYGWATPLSIYPHDSAATIIPHRGINASHKGEGTLAVENTSPRLGRGGSEGEVKGCIPRGWYRVDVTCSGKFKRPMPILRMVPGFEGIRIHAGLKVENTNGCICVGERWKESQLTKWLTEAQERREEIYICVTDKDHVDSELPNRSDPYRNCVGY